jgi:hypothetical protein
VKSAVIADHSSACSGRTWNFAVMTIIGVSSGAGRDHEL